MDTNTDSDGLPGDRVVKNPPAIAGDVDSVPGSGRSPGEGNGNPLQYSCLGNPMDKGAWRATVQRVRKSFIQTKYASGDTSFHDGNSKAQIIWQAC